MRYQLKQDLIALGDDFTIKDDAGRLVATVDGKVLSIGDKLALLDPRGKELLLIKEKLLSIGPTYEIERAGQVLARVKKDLFTLFRCSFTVDVPGPDDLTAQGDFLEHDYAFERGGREVARVSKKWFALSDTYGVDVAGGQDDLLILASAVVIDMCCHHDHEKKRGH